MQYRKPVAALATPEAATPQPETGDYFDRLTNEFVGQVKDLAQ